VAWAASRDATIIEDDYDAEFRYDREPVGALQGLATDRVAALGTVSKSLAPSVRLGWGLCPPSLAAALTEEKGLSDRGRPGIAQLALARLLESGRYDRHLRHMRATYAARRTALVEALARHAPEVKVTGLAAGFHAVAHLPEPVSEQAAVAGAPPRSVGLYGTTARPGRARPRSSCWDSATWANEPSSPASPPSGTCSGRPAQRNPGESPAGRRGRPGNHVRYCVDSGGRGAKHLRRGGREGRARRQ